MKLIPDWLSRKNSVTRLQLGELAEWLAYKVMGGSASEKTAVEVTAVYAAVRVIAEGVGQMPMRIRERSFDDKGREKSPDVRKHWAWKLMVERPNSWMTPFEFREYAVSMAVLFGDFVAVKNGPTRGRNAGIITELLPLVPGSWVVEQDPKSYALKYKITLAKNQTLELTDKDVFRFRGPPDTNGYSGAKPVKIARQSILLSSSLEKHQAQLATNGGRPSGILSSENKIKPEQAKLIKDAWTEKFGASGEGGVAVLDGGWKFNTMTMTNVDAQHIETRKHQIEEIARLFYVFPQMIMQSDKTSTFASAESFFRAHVTYTLNPWVVRFEQAVDRDILAGVDGGNLFADLEESQLLKGDFKDQADFNSKALGAGGTPAWMTQNEVRVASGMEAIDDPMADKLFNGFQANITEDGTNDGT